MDRRSFLKKIISPLAPEGEIYTLDAENLRRLSTAVGREPQEIAYTDSEGFATYDYTYYLQRSKGGKNAGVVIVSVRLTDARKGVGEVNVTDMRPGRQPRRHTLDEATHFGVSDEKVTFCQGNTHLSISLGPEHEVKLRHLEGRGF